jgi:outer membrane receptor protein involved in Fe transport
LSVSYFKKVIDNPIEYVEAAQGFTFTKPINYPRGKLTGWEAEIRQDLGQLWGPLSGCTVGGNSTWIDATVRRPDQEVAQFEQFQGVRPRTTRDMTDAPDYLLNLFTTYDIAATGTSFGVFYTKTGDRLIQGPGPSNNNFIPATYDLSYDNLTAQFSQQLSEGVRVSLGVSNFTDATRTQVYRSEYLANDVVRRQYQNGITYSLSIGGVIRF